MVAVSHPYCIHLRHAHDASLDRLVELGAIDVDLSPDGGIDALMPGSVTLEHVANALGRAEMAIAPAISRDAGSVWILRPRAFRVGRLLIAPADADAQPGAVRLLDTPAFGTGLHPSTALCLELLNDIADTDAPDRVLDVGTGSGILALAAVTLGIAHATAIDIDEAAVRVAGANARLNGLSDRVNLTHGGPDTLTGTWPLVLANVLAAPLIEMAPVLVRRLGHRGRLILSGIGCSLEDDVARAYRRLGLHVVSTSSRDGWVALLLHASW